MRAAFAHFSPCSLRRRPSENNLVKPRVYHGTCVLPARPTHRAERKRGLEEYGINPEGMAKGCAGGRNKAIFSSRAKLQISFYVAKVHSSGNVINVFSIASPWSVKRPTINRINYTDFVISARRISKISGASRSEEISVTRRETPFGTIRSRTRTLLYESTGKSYNRSSLDGGLIRHRVYPW